jgi:hypothetical protein
MRRHFKGLFRRKFHFRTQRGAFGIERQIKNKTSLLNGLTTTLKTGAFFNKTITEAILMKKIFTFIFLIILLTATYGMSATVANVTLPDTYKVDDYFLMLNGTALRKKLIIKVYAGGFYTPFKISGVAQAINPEIPKAIRMHFIYKSVSRDKIIKAYTKVYKKDGFDYKNSEAAQTFLKFFSFDVKKDDTLDLVFPGNGDIRVVYNSKVIGSVNSTDLCGATLKAYFGLNSIPGLREGFLGLEKN